jgi:hypothetical protein
MNVANLPVDQRILARVNIDPTTGCWMWTGASWANGYGYMQVDGLRGVGAHRVAYSLWVGEIPDGHHVHHDCEQPACVNPQHLRALSPADHEAHHASTRTTCAAGHPWDDANTRIDSRGHRKCRACHREQAAATYVHKGRQPASLECSTCGCDRVRVGDRMVCRPCESARNSAAARAKRAALRNNSNQQAA